MGILTHRASSSKHLSDTDHASKAGHTAVRPGRVCARSRSRVVTMRGVRSVVPWTRVTRSIAGRRQSDNSTASAEGWAMERAVVDGVDVRSRSASVLLARSQFETNEARLTRER